MSESHLFYLTEDKKKYIHYEVFRNLVPVTTLFIHGNLSSNRWWYPLLEKVRENQEPKLAGDIIFAEIRGCGQSSDVLESEYISILQLADDFVALAKMLKLKTFNIVGHSTGGSLAMVMLSQMGKTIERAVLVDPVGARGKKFDIATMKTFENMKSDIQLVEEVMRVTILTPNIDPIFFKEVVVNDAARAAKVMGLKIAKAFGEFNFVNQLGSIQSEVLVLHGDRDQVLEMDDSLELANLIPLGRFKALSGMGHCPNLQDPAGLWIQINNFLYS